MSESSATTFSVPADCFGTLPSTFSLCVPTSLSTPHCYWSNPSTCFPPATITITGGLNDFDILGLDGGPAYARTWQSSPIVTQSLGYSTDSLPSIFATISTHTLLGGRTVAQACLTGWNTFGASYCTSNVYAGISLTDPSLQYTAPISVFMAQLQNTFGGRDETSPMSSPTTTDSSASVRPTSAQAGSLGETPPTATSSAAPTPTPHPGLATGAKAGIGIGIAAVVIILFVIVIFFFRRTRSKSRNSKMNRADSKRPYLDQKHELDNSAIQRQEKSIPEMAGRDEVQELDTSGSMRDRYELEGGFMGYEAGHAPER